VTHHHGEPPPEPELLGRPFLDAGQGAPTASPGRHTDPTDSLDAIVDPSGRLRDDIRPYLMTGGRTAAAGPQVAMETVVALSRLARNGPIPRQAFERARILRRCQQPCSVAELAARLDIPLGVASVLVTDLIAEGLLDASTARREQQAHDVDFLRRLIAGVSAL
jgi:hypothetical protein